jgi:nucleotide-binding universal stress UspA family protein
MFNNILCPIDFTTFSHHALEHAVSIGRSLEAAVTAIHVVADSTLLADLQSAPCKSTTEALAGLQAQVLRSLKEMNAPSPTAVVMVGDPATEIVKLALARPTDLIVMPSHGWTGRGTASLGTVTEQVLCRTTPPVVVVPDVVAGRTATPAGGFRRIVCGIDFSPASLTGLRIAGDLASASRAQLVVTYVLPRESVPTTSTTPNESPDADSDIAVWRRRLHSSAQSDMPADVSVEEQLLTGDPATEILQLARNGRCDLIVIGGHRGNPRGRVMNAVAVGSPSPVLIARVSH